MDIAAEYQKANAYQYGLKVTSPFAERFKDAAAAPEIIEIPAGEHRTLKRAVTDFRLTLVYLYEGASFEYTETATGMVTAKSDIHIFLKGRGARAAVSARYEIDGGSELDVLHRVYHQAGGTTSRLSARGALSGSTRVIYRSGIGMERGHKGLSGSEEARFLLLSKEARAEAIPALDVAGKDISTSHALSVSRVREEALFYPKSRGLSEAAARALIVEGFLAHA